MGTEIIIPATKERKAVERWLQIDHVPRQKRAQFAYLKIIKEGIKTRAVNSFVDHSLLSKKQVSKLLHVSPRTLQRNVEKRLDVQSSERLLELTRLYILGEEVLGSTQKFNTWLNRNNQALSDQKPIGFLETSLGIDMIEDELIRIEFGVFS